MYACKHIIPPITCMGVRISIWIGAVEMEETFFQVSYRALPHYDLTIAKCVRIYFGQFASVRGHVVYVQLHSVKNFVVDFLRYL